MASVVRPRRLSSAVRVFSDQYQQYERGAATRGGTPTNPRLATVLAICQALDVEIDALLPDVPMLVTRQR